MPAGQPPIVAESLMRAVRARHPRLGEALVADAAVYAQFRGERHLFRSRLDAAAQVVRLAWSSDAFLAQAFYRTKARLQALGVPVLPRICHRVAVALGQVTIGDPVVVQPGLYLLHGQVVIDGLTEIGARARIAPFVTIGLRQGNIRGPRIGGDVEIGTGAKVLGPVTVGERASIGANAVVIDDVPAETTVVGTPAHPVSERVA
jgi:serine O-acetyltransferase